MCFSKKKKEIKGRDPPSAEANVNWHLSNACFNFEEASANVKGTRGGKEEEKERKERKTDNESETLVRLIGTNKIRSRSGMIITIRVVQNRVS